MNNGLIATKQQLIYEEYMLTSERIEMAKERIWLDKKEYLVLPKELQENYFIIYEYLDRETREEAIKAIDDLPPTIAEILKKKKDPLEALEQMILELHHNKRIKRIKEMEIKDYGEEKDMLKYLYHLYEY